MLSLNRGNGKSPCFGVKEINIFRKSLEKGLGFFSMDVFKNGKLSSFEITDTIWLTSSDFGILKLLELFFEQEANVINNIRMIFFTVLI